MKHALTVLLVALSMLTAAAQTEKGRFTLDLSNFSSVGLLTGNQPLFAPTNGLGIAFGNLRIKADGKLLEPKSP